MAKPRSPPNLVTKNLAIRRRREGGGQRNGAAGRMEFSQSCRADARQAGLQLRSLPRGPGRQRGLSALAARLRSGHRLLQYRQAGPRPARRTGRSGTEPAAREALRGRSRTKGACASRPTRSNTASSPSGSPPEPRPRRTTIPASNNSKSCRAGRSIAWARRSRSWSGPAIPTAGRKTSPGGSSGRPATKSVCRVDDDGLASVIGPGEGAIVAWYASKIAIARITVPYVPVAGELSRWQALRLRRQRAIPQSKSTRASRATSSTSRSTSNWRG